MIKYWHNDGRYRSEEQTLSQDCGSIFEREFYSSVLIVQVDKVEIPFEGKRRSNKQTGEEEAVRKILKWGLNVSPSVFDCIAVVGKFCNQNHHIN
jgi:hypothetical protein